MTGRAKHPGQKKDRPRGVAQRNPEVYRKATKPSGAQRCTECGLVEYRGRWSRRAPGRLRLADGLCPACRRVRERYPAGTVRVPKKLCGDRDALVRLIRNTEKAEAAEHPLERLMDIKESGGNLVVTTTGVHLARQVAHQLARQFHRKPHFRYAEGESLVRVDWKPPAEQAAKRPRR